MKYNHKFFDNPKLAFEIAKEKSVDFKNNIHDYMFMYATDNQLHFKILLPGSTYLLIINYGF